MASSRSNPQILRLPRNVPASFRKRHTHKIASRRGRKGERRREWKSLTYSTLACKRAAAVPMSQNPYTNEHGEKWISRQIFWQSNTVKERQRLQRNFLIYGCSVTAETIFHTPLNRLHTGHRLTKQEVEGQKFSKFDWGRRFIRLPVSIIKS